MKKFICWLVMAAGISMLASTATAQKDLLGTKRVLTLAVAKKLAAAAEQEVCKQGCSGTIAIVNDSGYLIFVETFDNPEAPQIELAIRKAHTAALYKRSTQEFHDAVTKGTNLSYQDGSFPDMTTTTGGVPFVVDGEVIGAIGTSGTHSTPLSAPVDAAVKALAQITAH